MHHLLLPQTTAGSRSGTQVNVNTPEDEKFPWMKRFMNQMVSKFRTLHGDKLKYYDSRLLKDAKASPGKEKQYLRAHRRRHLEDLDRQQRKEYQRTQAYYAKYGFPEGTKMAYRVPKEMPLPLEDY